MQGGLCPTVSDDGFVSDCRAGVALDASMYRWVQLQRAADGASGLHPSRDQVLYVLWWGTCLECGHDGEATRRHPMVGWGVRSPIRMTTICKTLVMFDMAS